MINYIMQKSKVSSTLITTYQGNAKFLEPYINVRLLFIKRLSINNNKSILFS